MVREGAPQSQSDQTDFLAFLLHFIVTRFKSWQTARSTVLREALFLGLGALLPLVFLLVYQGLAFGSPFAYGYQYGLMYGLTWGAIRDNIYQLWAPLLIAYPLLMLTLPVLFLTAYQKLVPHIPFLKHRVRLEDRSDLPDGLFWLLGGWFLAVFGPYLFYAGTAGVDAASTPFMFYTRFYLPALLPLVFLGALCLARLPKRFVFGFATAVVVLGLLFFLQSANTVVVYQTAALVLPLARGGL